MKAFTAGPNEHNMRLSRFVQQVTTGLPSSALYKAFRNKRIKVNTKKGVAEQLLCDGDHIELYLNDEFFVFHQKKHDSAQIKDPMPHFDVVWEGNGIFVLYKPAGVLCHSDASCEKSLLDAFTHYLTTIGEYHAETENTFAPSLCNRLDRGTEGLVLAAKNAPALRAMNSLIRDGFVQKTYLAVVIGVPPSGEHSAFLTRDKASKKVLVTVDDCFGAKKISTSVHILEQKKGLALCEIGLITGRTHQIRAHLAYLGTPLLGDRKYGKPTPNDTPHISTQALCAWKLGFSDDIPREHLLSGLAGKRFVAQNAKLPDWWKKISDLG